MLNPYRITMEAENTDGTGLTELYIDEARSVILVHPRLDVELSLDDPEVGQGWADLKRRIRSFAEYVLANGNDNSAGACIEQLAREARINSESFHIETYIGSAGNEEAADLYIDSDATVSMILPDRDLGQPGSDIVAFFSDRIGPELAKKWADLKELIRGFVSFLATMKDHKEVALA
jgi:hypothetical protein